MPWRSAEAWAPPGRGGGREGPLELALPGARGNDGRGERQERREEAKEVLRLGEPDRVAQERELERGHGKLRRRVAPSKSSTNRHAAAPSRKKSYCSDMFS